MDELRRARDPARYWPRLRAEAHDLYREAAALRERIRELERALSDAKGSLARSQQKIDRLAESERALRARLNTIEHSRGWRVVMSVRRVRRLGRAPRGRGASVAAPATPAQVSPSPARQGSAADAARRADAAAALTAWIQIARAARAGVALVLAGDPARLAPDFLRPDGVPLCMLEDHREPEGLIGAIAPAITPSLVPDLLRADLGDARRVFACTAPDHTAIRWVVPAQQAGWSTVLVVDDARPPAIRYLATHCDAVIATREEVARDVEAATGVRPTVVARPGVHDLASAAAAAPRSLPRNVLDIP